MSHRPMTPPIVERLNDWLDNAPLSKPPYDDIREAADTIEELVEKADLLVETLYLHDLPPKTLNALTELEIVLIKITGNSGGPGNE